jgi:biopolymer transport protein ExbD
MINVVFLLLIFFLLTAQFSDSATGTSGARDAPDLDPEAAPHNLILSPEGVLSYRDLQGAEAMAAAVAEGPVRLAVDGGTQAHRLASALRALGKAGARRVDLVTPMQAAPE